MARRAGTALRVAILSRRDGARLIASARHTVDRRPTSEAMLHSLTAAGFTPPQSLQALRTVSHDLFGAVLDEQATAQDTPPDPGDRFDGFPYLRAATVGREAEQLEQQFEYGLGCVLSGIRNSLNAG